MLALRESTDNMAMVLPEIERTELLITLLFECTHLWLLLECIIDGNKPPANIVWYKDRLMHIVDDYRHLYRLNIGKGISSAEGGAVYFVQSIMGNFL